ncbi:dihydroorotate dehydrogenase [Loxospora ochrophaea]|nr:dihydroorotate dehydrogenase [Loxospora ochrophaea]
MDGITTPLLNSASAWATTYEELLELYQSPYTGAVSVRTCTLDGFYHSDDVHHYALFDAEYHVVDHSSRHDNRRDEALRATIKNVSSINSLGYSPTPLAGYLRIITRIQEEARSFSKKPFIISIAELPINRSELHAPLEQCALTPGHSLMLELNLSCPNIPGKPPPAYSRSEILWYCRYFMSLVAPRHYEVGFKIPPYTHQGQFDDLIEALLEATKEERLYVDTKCPVSFITATNTLGNCFLTDRLTGDSMIKSANGSGIGGAAGAMLHPLALGTVRTLRRMLDAHPPLKHIRIIGVGGVSDGAGYQRMRDAGASFVAVGTALGMHGVGIFKKIANEAQVMSGN